MSAASFWKAVEAGALRTGSESGAVSPAAPSARAVTVRGWGKVSAAEDREFDGIMAHLEAGDEKAGEVA
jgi:hypothetical protein